MKTVLIKLLGPDGIRETDHAFVGDYDETCSRCRRPIAADEVPVLIEENRGQGRLWVYCAHCTDVDVIDPT